MSLFWSVVCLGVGATATVDLWAIVRQRLFAVAQPNYGLVGRWIAHMRHGRFVHEAISRAEPVRGENLIGWTAHYLIGIGFAALLILVAGPSWLEAPSLVPALAVGVVTVAAPYLLLQPGMGAGIAARRTANPASARLNSLLMHAVFGLGLYGTGWLIKLLLP